MKKKVLNKIVYTKQNQANIWKIYINVLFLNIILFVLLPIFHID